MNNIILVTERRVNNYVVPTEVKMEDNVKWMMLSRCVIVYHILLVSRIQCDQIIYKNEKTGILLSFNVSQ